MRDRSAQKRPRPKLGKPDKARQSRVDAEERLGPPDYVHELAFGRQYGGCVAGIDEAGRGPWAGPVVAAAVVLDPLCIPNGLADSKQLTAAKRESLFAAICGSAQFGIGIADVGRIDRDNILAATLWAMEQAATGLAKMPAVALIDGNRCPSGLPFPAHTIVKGDARCLSIAAASIIAKVTRDRIMDQYALDNPGYGWERNKGYGTAEHQRAIAQLGVSSQHRRSFRPIRIALGQD